jgi:hypothetical protein
VNGGIAFAGATSDARGLAEAFETECRLLSELATVLRKQREGVACDDVAVVDDSVFAAHRVMRTLDEARKRRRTLLEIIAGAQDASLEDLELTLGRHMTPGLANVRDRLRLQAKTVAREIEINRRVLRGAMEQGDRFIQAICGGKSSASYESREPSGGQGVLLNRQA